MTRWTALDYAVAFAPFLILAGFAAHAIRRGQRTCVCCDRAFPTVAERRFHEQIPYKFKATP